MLSAMNDVLTGAGAGKIPDFEFTL